jgi:AAA domain
MSFQFPKLPDNENDIISLMKHHQIKFVVFDSLVRFHNKDENSSTDMRLILESFTRINMETGASVLLIHHLAKQSTETKRGIWERVRGTSDFVAWRDCMMGLEGNEGDDLVQCSFQFRDAENPAPIQIQRKLNETTGAMTLNLLSLQETDSFKEKLARIYGIITANYGSATREFIAKKMGGHRADTLRFIKQVESLKLLAKNGLELGVPT